jgi:hypothetical protein
MAARSQAQLDRASERKRVDNLSQCADPVIAADLHADYLNNDK